MVGGTGGELESWQGDQRRVLNSGDMMRALLQAVSQGYGDSVLEGFGQF